MLVMLAILNTLLLLILAPMLLFIVGTILWVSGVLAFTLWVRLFQTVSRRLAYFSPAILGVAVGFLATAGFLWWCVQAL